MINIHQAHFAPWIPYYSRISAASTFVVLDDVQYRRYYYQNRVLFIDRHKRPFLITVPVLATTHTQSRDVRIFGSTAMRKLRNAIYYTYARAPYFKESWAALSDAFGDNTKWLIDLNLNVLSATCFYIGLAIPPIRFSSQIITTTDSTDRIISICSSLNDRVVISGWGGSTITHDANRLFVEGISFRSIEKERVVRSGFDADVYRGVSILDAIFGKGPAWTFNTIKAIAGLYRVDQNVTSKFEMEST
jgi:hypothetical protein